jgi:hypothetical protein
MGRPIYEKQSDVHKQEAVRRTIERWLGPSRVLVGPLKPSWRADYFITKRNHDGERVISSFLEIKCRKHDYGTYPTLMVSYDKLRRLHTFCNSFAHDDFHFAALTRCIFPRVLLCVLFNRDLYFTDASAETAKRNFRVHFGGRTDRNDARDIEKLYHIPISLFKRVPIKETNND